MAKTKSKKSNMFSLDIVKNFAEGFKPDSLIADGLALLTPVLYTIPATVFGMSGWTGLIFSFALPYMVGKAFRIPSMCHAAVGIAAQHIIYTKAGGAIKDVLGKPIWAFNTSAVYDGNTPPSSTPPSSTPPISSTTPINGLSDYQYVKAGGETLLAYNPAEIAAKAVRMDTEGLPPEPRGTETINDFINVPVTGDISARLNDGLATGNNRGRRNMSRVRPLY